MEQRNMSDIYVPKCWVDLSFNSRLILDFFFFETEDFWIKIKNIYEYLDDIFGWFWSLLFQNKKKLKSTQHLDT